MAKMMLLEQLWTMARNLPSWLPLCRKVDDNDENEQIKFKNDFSENSTA